jgi:shikimate 5-dehydrogenase
MSSAYPAATQPTFYFIGVTTAKSSIMQVFPAWARYLGLKDAVIKGIDFPLHADPAAYREAVAFIKQDSLSLGALVTTHKLDLFEAAKDMFDEIDQYAALMGETSCLSKRDGKLVCHAKDPISSGLAIDGFLPERHFGNTGAELMSMGAGGSTIALTWHLMRRERGADVPSRIIVTDPSQHRLDDIRRIHQQIASDVPVDYVRPQGAEDNDAAMASLKPGSFVINATGLGKDRPGSPITDAAVFPEGGIAWELNYRGDLVFLDQARRQQSGRRLQVENGWTYFLHGWTQVIAEVFDVKIATHGPQFDEISRIAIEAAGG